MILKLLLVALAFAAMLLAYVFWQLQITEGRKLFAKRVDEALDAHTSEDPPLMPEEIEELHASRWN